MKPEKIGCDTRPVAAAALPQYNLNVRAVGYELGANKAIELPGERTATQDLKLDKTKDLAAQLSNGEWLASIPGTDRQKDQLLNCVGCHTVERIMRSTNMNFVQSNGMWSNMNQIFCISEDRKIFHQQ